MIKEQSKNSFWSYCFLGLVTLYALKGMVYPTGPISVGVALTELFMCSVFAVMAFGQGHRPQAINYLLILIAVVAVYYIFSKKIVTSSFLREDISTFAFFREFAGAVLPFFPAYYLAQKHRFNETLLLRFFVVYFVILIFVYFYETAQLIEQYHGREDVTSNYAYSFVYMVPFLGLFKRKLLTIPFWGIAIALSMLSAKRGVMLGIGVQLFIYSIIIFWKSKHKFVLSIIFLVCFIVASQYILDYYNDNAYFQSRIEDTLEGNSSARDDLMDSLWTYFAKSWIFYKVFGNGFASSVDIAGNYAHNDWMEILIDMGVVNLIWYLMIYVCLWKYYKRIDVKYRTAMFMAIMSLFVSSFFSMSFFSTGTATSFILIGFLMGNNQYMVARQKTNANM